MLSRFIAIQCRLTIAFLVVYPLGVWAAGGKVLVVHSYHEMFDWVQDVNFPMVEDYYRSGSKPPDQCAVNPAVSYGPERRISDKCRFR
jgi:hypothetical protein